MILLTRLQESRILFYKTGSASNKQQVWARFLFRFLEEWLRGQLWPSAQFAEQQHSVVLLAWLSTACLKPQRPKETSSLAWLWLSEAALCFEATNRHLETFKGNMSSTELFSQSGELLYRWNGMDTGDSHWIAWVWSQRRIISKLQVIWIWARYQFNLNRRRLTTGFGIWWTASQTSDSMDRLIGGILYLPWRKLQKISGKVLHGIL